MTTHPPTAAVQESFGQAQQQATSLAGPPPAWNAATGAPRRSPLWIALAAASVVASGVVGWFGVEWFGGAARVAPAHVGDQNGKASPSPLLGQSPGTSHDAASGSASPARPSPLASPPAAPVPTAALPASLTVTRPSGLIRIAAVNASLAEAVRSLAQATHTNVRGAEALTAITTPITLNWQGSETAAAWDALLGRFGSIAVSCSGAACDLWIVGVNAPRAASGSPAAATIGEAMQAPRPVAAVPVPVPAPMASHTETPAQPPGSEENTETN